MAPRNDPLEDFTLPRLRIFMTVIEEGRWRRASSVLDISDQAIKKNIKILENAFNGRPLLNTDSGGRVEPTSLGQALYERAGMMLRLGTSLADLNRTLKPATMTAFLPHHAAFVAPTVATLTGNPDFNIQIEVLGEQHRSVDVFQRVVVDALSVGAFDVIIGPPPETVNDELDTYELYEAILVALVTKDHSDEITVQELSTQQLLLPPVDTRAGQKIRNVLRPLMTSDSALTANIRLAAHGTKVLAIFGTERLGTVIVPSDIVHAFSPGGALQGDALRQMKWVPVLDAEKKPLTHKVVATVRHVDLVRDPAILQILQTLHKKAKSG